MKIVPLMAILALSQTGISVPVTVYETATILSSPLQVSNSPISTQTVALQTTIPTTFSASTQATTTTNASGIMALLQGIYSAVTGSSSSSTPSTSVSGSPRSWKSFLSSLFEGIGNGSLSPTAPPSSINKPWQSSSVSSIPSAATSTQTPSSSTSSTASQSSQTDGIYDEIYNSSEQIDTVFAQSILDAHNEYRKEHGVGALSWAQAPYTYAKQNADNYDCSGVLTHTHGQYGENLAAGFPNGPAAVAAWYSEGETFNYAASNEYNHFTQVVWKGSTQVGCAYKDCSAEGWQRYVVCEYNPPGNFIGEERTNVLPPVT